MKAKETHYILPPLLFDEYHFLCYAIHHRAKFYEETDDQHLAEPYRHLLKKIDTAKQVIK